MRIQLDTDYQKRMSRKYWRLTRAVFVKCRQQVIDMAEYTDPDRLKARVSSLLDPEPMKKHIIELWGEIGGHVGGDMVQLLDLKKYGKVKYETKAAKTKEWNERMKRYAAERSLKKIEAIMTTEEEAINKVIDMVIDKSLDEGLGIEETRRLLKKDLLGDQMLSIENFQAQRIAMTEVGAAQNTASFLAAKENSEDIKKVWMFIPGMKSFREEHQGFEALGGVSMDYEYAPGLKHPGDVNGSAEQVINCYCSISYEIE